MKVKDLKIREAKEVYRGRFVMFFVFTQFFGIITLIMFNLNLGDIYLLFSYCFLALFLADAFLMILNLILSKENKDKYFIYKTEKEKSIPLNKKEICDLFKIKEDSFPKLLERLKK